MSMNRSTGCSTFVTLDSDSGDGCGMGDKDDGRMEVEVFAPTHDFPRSVGSSVRSDGICTATPSVNRMSEMSRSAGTG